MDFKPGQDMIIFSGMDNEEIDKAYFEFTFACDNYFFTKPERMEGEKSLLVDLGFSLKFK